jgi:hypothetical protein
MITRTHPFIKELLWVGVVAMCVGLAVGVILYMGKDAPEPETEITIQWDYPEEHADRVDGFKIYQFELVDVLTIYPGEARQFKAMVKERGKTCFRISAFNAEHEVLAPDEFVCHGMEPVQGLHVVQ